jgi:hypothetical protein
MGGIDPRVYKVVAVAFTLSTAFAVGAQMYLVGVVSAAIVFAAVKLHPSDTVV